MNLVRSDLVSNQFHEVLSLHIGWYLECLYAVCAGAGHVTCDGYMCPASCLLSLNTAAGVPRYTLASSGYRPTISRLQHRPHFRHLDTSSQHNRGLAYKSNIYSKCEV